MTIKGTQKDAPEMERHSHIRPLSQEMEDRLMRNPLLNIDTFIIPSPYVKDPEISKDREYSSIWIDEGEILGYMLVYSDREKRNYLIYKVVTSPFGRGRGIGTSFIENLARRIPEKSRIYLYIWEKQIDTVDFFHKKGFQSGDPIVYRNLIYNHLYAGKEEISLHSRLNKRDYKQSDEEIGKARHDARKTLRLLSSMVDMLSVDNGERIIEDINRETTTLINMLNSFRDTMQIVHKVNLQEVILDRMVPYIEASTIPCELHLKLSSRVPMVPGYYVDIGRALINLVSNALDSINDTSRRGIIEISISRKEDIVLLKLKDNGAGIPPEKLIPDKEGYPAFVGVTTKKDKTGEGLGTLQIYSTFGAANITVDSILNEGTTWYIRMGQLTGTLDKWYIQMDRRLNEFKQLWEEPARQKNPNRSEYIASIWQLRKMEIFLFDLILKFSKFHNIRMIFRSVLSYLQGIITEKTLQEEVNTYRSEYETLGEWLMEISRAIRKRQERLFEAIDISKFRGAMFKSYGQAFENVIIFTFDPETGNFLATDRKLAEHLDFVPYLKKERNQLLRGEFIGDMNNDNQPIFLGVWSVDSREDLIKKLKLIRRGARKLLEIGIHKNKKLALYQTTYVRHSEDIDSDRCCTFKEIANCSDKDLLAYIRKADDEFQNFFAAAD
ncbi:MAG: hypothetical protein B6241_11685 [Spirochaetaceae bacterium 4572_59]|nr:MAG: hypothetical protein B6241_11685 [Spirochaetaceae bacterium 4572_59]